MTSLIPIGNQNNSDRSLLDGMYYRDQEDSVMPENMFKPVRVINPNPNAPEDSFLTAAINEAEQQRSFLSPNIELEGTLMPGVEARPIELP
ncbi:MAG: hypothetical protein SFU25_02290 [Candidatus Caenarcaniphilales bacterium]|nr:hypothetical protein [Candidatus Caenarcaniphilales bacterium]